MHRLYIPFAIVIGGFLIASAFLLRNGEISLSAQQKFTPQRAQFNHVYGAPDAPVTIVEFSDLECPFCARLHPTLKQIVDESDGEINWEYRHFPLRSHRNAEYAAVVAECVSRLQNNTAFWEYINTLFTSGSRLNEQYLNSLAYNRGITTEELTSCTENQHVHELVNTDATTATALGGTGTPFSVIVFADGTTRSVSGALPYAQWKQLLE